LPFVKVGGVFIAMKAKECDDELSSAQNAIEVLGGKVLRRVDYPLYNTGITHTALIIEKISETPEKYPRRFAKIKAKPL
jgi:16S rRNA (guanine527-N7)-methyltransferase